MAMFPRRINVGTHGSSNPGGGFAPPSGGGGGGGIPPLPPGVTTQQIDGGPTYYADHGFTLATSFPTSFNYTSGMGVLNYAHGWDDPFFFPTCIFLPSYGSTSFAASAAHFQSVGINVIWCIAGSLSGQSNALFNSGISFVMNYPEYNQFLRIDNGVNATPGGNAIVGWYTQDEPVNVNIGIRNPIIGTPVTTTTGSIASNTYTAATVTGALGAEIISRIPVPPDSYESPPILSGGVPPITGSGTTAVFTDIVGGGTGGAGGGSGVQYIITPTADLASVTLTQAAVLPLTATEVGARFLFTAFNGSVVIRFQTLDDPTFGTTVPPRATVNNFLTKKYTDQASNPNRRVEGIGYDIYFFLFALTTPGCATAAATYDTNAIQTFTKAECAKGTHYGVMIDYLRSFCTDPTLGTNSMPLFCALDNSNSVTGKPYDTPGVQFNWAAWSSIIHGARALFWFNHIDNISPSFPTCSGATGEDNFLCSFNQTTQSVNFTGTLSAGGPSGTQLTVALGAVSSGLIYPGMKATSGVSGDSVVQFQTGYTTGTFTASISHTAPTTLVVSAVSAGVISTPAYLETGSFGGGSSFGQAEAFQIGAGPGGGGPGNYTLPRALFCVASGSTSISGTTLTTTTPIFGPILVNSVVAGGTIASGTTIVTQLTGPIGGAGTYQVSISQTVGATSNVSFTGGDLASETMTCQGVNPGLDGVYAVSGGTGSGLMTYTQSDAGFGGKSGTFPSNVSFQGTTPSGTQVNTRVREMAPVINSPFAVAGSTGLSHAFVTSTSPPLAYEFPSDDGILNHFPPQSIDFGRSGSSGPNASKAIHCCVKYYTGSPFMISSGETITPGFYIFATTCLPAQTAPFFNVTFNVQSGSSVTVLGESGRAGGQTIPIVAGSFTDTFDFAWTVRIYRVNP